MITPIERVSFNLQEVSEYLGVCYHTAYRMIKAGKLKHYVVGRNIFVRKEVIDSWIEEQENRQAN